MSETEAVQKASALENETAIFQNLPHFRAIVAEDDWDTTPILQQAWSNIATGVIEWRAIALVSVPRAEYDAVRGS